MLGKMHRSSFKGVQGKELDFGGSGDRPEMALGGGCALSGLLKDGVFSEAIQRHGGRPSQEASAGQRRLDKGVEL